jgi:hypothetical protein
MKYVPPKKIIEAQKKYDKMKKIVDVASKKKAKNLWNLISKEIDLMKELDDLLCAELDKILKRMRARRKANAR